MDRIESILDAMDVKYTYYDNKDGTYYGIVEFWTDTAGQDIINDFYFDGTAEDFVRKFTEGAELYDVDEEVSLYVDYRGENGVPETVRELLDDCQEAKDTLMLMAKALGTAV